jgi:hypothetical protein
MIAPPSLDTDATPLAAFAESSLRWTDSYQQASPSIALRPLAPRRLCRQFRVLAFGVPVYLALSSEIGIHHTEIRFLSSAQAQALIDRIGHRESSNAYEAVNALGYAGRYQFGPVALVDVGLMHREALQDPARRVSEIMADAAAWTLPGGVQTFLSDAATQDNAMWKLLTQNERTLYRLGLIDVRSKPQEVAGLLMVAHLLGCGGALRFKAGADGTDAFGTSASEYYQLGSTAF